MATHFWSTGESLLTDLVVRANPEDPQKADLFYPMFLLFVLYPIIEELYYRGFIYSVLANLMNVKWAFGIVAVWFTLVHVPQLLGDPMGIPFVAVMSILCTWLRFKSDSLYPALICHITYNATLVLMSITQVTLYNHGFLSPT